MERPNWDEYFSDMVDLVSRRSTCLRRRCGAVIVKENQVMSTGYNGAPSGTPHCTEQTCIRLINNIPSGERMEWCRGAHAEQNAIAQAAKNGVSIKGAVMYISGQPCSMCTKNIINSGIVEIVILHTDPKPYSDKLADELIKQSGIKVRHVFDSYKRIWEEDWLL